MLTQKQFELLTFLEKKIGTSGVAPSFEEMKIALGLRSKSGIHRLICALEERGFLKKLPHRARSIEILRSSTSFENGKVTPESFSKLNSKVSNAKLQTNRAIPMIGRIAAGSPMEALKNCTDLIDIPESLLGVGTYFALNVIGDSMIDIGINDGDIAIVREKSEAKTGDIVVALINDSEATLKKLKKEPGKIILEAKNKKYPPQVYDRDTQVRIQGVLSGIIRKYN